MKYLLVVECSIHTRTLVQCSPWHISHQQIGIIDKLYCGHGLYIPNLSFLEFSLRRTRLCCACVECIPVSSQPSGLPPRPGPSCSKHRHPQHYYRQKIQSLLKTTTAFSIPLKQSRENHHHRESVYRSVPGKPPWALTHNSWFQPTWELTQDKKSIHLYATVTPWNGL